MRQPKKFTKQRQRAAFRIAKAMMDLSENGNLYVMPYDELASLRFDLNWILENVSEHVEFQRHGRQIGKK